jgi:hypothetical protein
MRRPLRYDGLLPAKVGYDGKRADLTPADIPAIKAFIAERRTQASPFDIVVEGQTPGVDPEQAASMVRPWAEAGATWWIEGMWDALYDPDKRSAVRERIQQGPPRLNLER